RNDAVVDVTAACTGMTPGVDVTAACTGMTPGDGRDGGVCRDDAGVNVTAACAGMTEGVCPEAYFRGEFECLSFS
ncbi:MAG TPA: hypothetical protein PK480_10660, partial [Candidatus Hydrogenedentes bacterium]|nr:hypothetical protein [Candidatus Hydrogenedentota bacterium]